MSIGAGAGAASPQVSAIAASSMETAATADGRSLFLVDCDPRVTGSG
ncbi:MAG TPA: hypothetical protein VF036_00285 [Actinomycetota bacterium]